MEFYLNLLSQLTLLTSLQHAQTGSRRTRMSAISRPTLLPRPYIMERREVNCKQHQRQILQ